MKSKTIGMLAACALLLSACTSTGARYGMVARDGGWYSPAIDGRGDYYTSQLDYYEARDWPWDFHVGLTSFGGYCPVRYRYCTSLYAHPFYSPLWMSFFYSPFRGYYYGPYYYDPFWYQPWVYYQRAPQNQYEQVAGAPVTGTPPRRHHGTGFGPSAERPRPRLWDERPASGRGSAGSGGRPRPAPVRRGDGTN